jgi:ATP-binding cassette subfamily C protein
MSEVEIGTAANGPLPSRVRVEGSTGSLRVVAGVVDVFAVASDGSFVSIATCEAGSFVVPPAAPASLEVLSRLGGLVEFTADVPDDAVEKFTERVVERLGGIAQSLEGATKENVGDRLAAVISAVIAANRDSLTVSATTSRVMAEGFLGDAIDRAVFSAQTLKSPVEGFDVSPLVAVFQLLGKAQKFIIEVPTTEELKSSNDKVRLIAHKSSLRYRTIELGKNWEQRAVTPFLGSLHVGDSTVPVALIRRGRHYTIQGSGDVRPRPLTVEDRANLEAEAIEVYTPFDPDREARLRDVLRISLVSTRSSWMLTILMAFGVVLLGLLTPIMTNSVIGTLIPNEKKGLLAAGGAGLVLAAMGIFVFSMVQNFSISRISQISTRNLQAAFWDRLMSLPVEFYRRFNSGELAIRALAVDNLSSILSVQVVSATLTAIFGVLYVVQMLYYSVPLGLAGLFFLFLTLMVMLLTLRGFNRQTVAMLDASMESNGWLVQMLTGISKIRIAQAENRMSAKYIEIIRRSIISQSRITVIGGWLNSWFIFAAVGAPALFYLVIYRSWSGDIPPVTTATYLAFYSAYTISFSAIAGLSGLMSSLASVAPMYKLVVPMMKELPETGGGRVDPGELSGRIELRDVQFRYTSDSPLILRGLSMVVEPGELVALVGKTGAGKSTITRLLLGFETAEDGQVLFDGKDFAGLDPTIVRHQMGVVMQNGRITRTSVLKNIMGDLSQDEDQAWEAARQAAIAEDIEAMPMGMHTIVDPSNISGGQAQRLLIARALVTKPKIVIMDEATSALDNTAQTQVTDALGGLQATRIVIAHRLSTIRSADRIIVLDNGIAAQTGTFDELISVPGLFQDLVKRQVA